MWNAIIGFLKKVLSVAIGFLPNSPFTEFINEVSNLPYLGYLNFFVPVSTLVNITVAWTGAIAIYYIVSAALRWAKAIT